ncbi:MAG TPA: glycosyl transferase family 51, partial [Pseudomonas sp.]|nr:glycosyl transferase family 51 [Pseudomonas sp.]
MSATNSQAAMPTPPRKRRSRLRLAIRLTLLVLLIAGGLLVANEMRTSHLQAYELSRYAKSLTYKVEPGPSPAIVYPKEGPFDKRLGYTHIPMMLERLDQRGFGVHRQARFSPALLDYAERGFFVPY